MRFHAVALAAALVPATAAMSEPSRTILQWTDLSGWESDNHDAALGAFLQTCTDLADRDWSTLCALAQDQAQAPGVEDEFFFGGLRHTGAIKGPAA